MCAMEYARLIRERNDPRWQQTTEVHTSSLTYQARPKAHYTARQTMEQLVFLLHGMATSSRTFGFDDQGGASLRGAKKETCLDHCMFIAIFFGEWLQWNRRSHFEPLCSATIFFNSVSRSHVHLPGGGCT